MWPRRRWGIGFIVFGLVLLRLTYLTASYSGTG